MEIWKIEIVGQPTDILSVCRRTYTYTGTATKPEIAMRAAYNCAKKDGLVNCKVKSLEHIGEKEFGRN